MKHFWKPLIKKVSAQKKNEFLESQAQNQVGIFWQNLFFALNLFFQRLLENFPLALRTRSRYLKRPPNIAVCVSKKIVTAPHTNQIICQKKWKKLRFWKNEAQNQVGIFWQNPIFWAETFFSKASRKFSIGLTNIFKVSERSA